MSGMNDHDVVASYQESDYNHVLRIGRGENVFQLTQSKKGYGMVVIADESCGEEVERYYALDMAIGDVAERLGVPVDSISIPEAAQAMGI